MSFAVGQLLTHGLVAEEGTRSSTGGRPRKVLRLGGSDGYAVAADLGGQHAHVGVVHPGGGLTDVSTVPFATADGPEAALPGLADTLQTLIDRHGREQLRGVGLCLPGPVDVEPGLVTLPARMPGWNRFPYGTGSRSASPSRWPSRTTPTAWPWASTVSGPSSTGSRSW